MVKKYLNTTISQEKKHHMDRNKLKKNHLLQLALSILVILMLGYISSRIFFRIDLTTEKRYTIHESTREVLKDLNDIIYVKVYLDGKLPAAFEELKRSVLETLEEFRAFGGSNIQYEFIDPMANEIEKERNDLVRQLVKKGLDPRTIREQDKDGMITKYLFPGAIIIYREEETVLNFFDSQSRNARAPAEVLVNEAESKLEYNFLTKIREATSIFPPQIAFVHGHGELERIEAISLARELDEMYTVEVINIDEQVYALRDSLRNKYEAIIIAKPRKRISDKDKYIIDQYIMHGGKVLWLLDYVDVHMDSLSQQSTTQALSLHRELNLNDMLFNYGVRINTGIIQDLSAAPIPINTAPLGGDPEFTPTPWVYFPVLTSRINHPITNKIGPIRTEFINSMDIVGENANIQKTVLLTTSEYSREISTPALINLNIINEKPDPNYYKNGVQNVAILLEGEFTSIFQNRLVDDFTNREAFKFKTTSRPTKMIVVSDGDIARNPVVTRDGQKVPLPLGADKWFNDIYFNGNVEFLLNAMNYLTDDHELVSLRGRKFQLRLLDKQRLRENKLYWRIINIVIPIVMMLIFAFVYNLLRRIKYAGKKK